MTVPIDYDVKITNYVCALEQRKYSNRKFIFISCENQQYVVLFRPRCNQTTNKKNTTIFKEENQRDLHFVFSNLLCNFLFVLY